MRAFRLSNACTSHPIDTAARSSSSSNSSASRWISSAKVSGVRQPKPTAPTIITTAAIPVTVPTTRRLAVVGAPIKTVGSDSKASPMTPPSPLGSGQPPLRGRQDTKVAASSTPADPEDQPQDFALQRAMRDQAPAPDRHRQHQHDGGEPEKLDQQIGGDGTGRAEQVAHRSVGGVAERRVLHRPGRERSDQHDRQHDQQQARSVRPIRRRIAPRKSSERKSKRSRPNGRSLA